MSHFARFYPVCWISPHVALELYCHEISQSTRKFNILNIFPGIKKKQGLTLYSPSDAQIIVVRIASKHQ